MNMSNTDAGSANINPDEWERIARYLTGEASSSEAEATRRWVEADRHRAEMVRLLESVLANVSRDDSSDIDVEGALKNAKSRLDSPELIPFVPRMALGEAGRSFPVLLRIAAAALVIVGAAGLWQSMRGSRGDAVGQTFATSVGERRQVALMDGTEVLLGPASRLVVASRSLGERMVALDGVAYFVVAQEPAHTFTVKAGEITIQDIGTAFAVENDDSAETRIGVDSGTVAIGTAEPNHGQGAVLNARDRAIVDTKGVVAVERSVVSADDLAWIQGRLVFREAPLILVGAELYRWYGVRLRVADSSLANLHLTASFSGEPVDRVLNVIALSLGARIERRGNVAILYRARASGARP